MGKKILFSPIGGTDPIKYMRDGSMLHICRVYQPDVVYFYLSYEMALNHDKDNRYVLCLKKLGDLLGHEFQIEIIRRDDLKNVQQFDPFYEDFRKEIARIEQQMADDDELYVNMASGTPAMKSALFVMATLAEYRFHAIQVSTPQKKQNTAHDDREDFDVDLEWECDVDNQVPFENRCNEVKSSHLICLLKIDMIKKHLLAYDYHAALNVAEEIREDITPQAYTLIKMADMREKLMLKEISKMMRGAEAEYFPIRDGDKQELFEYALGLKIKLQRQELADYVRGITPIVVDLLERILKTQCGIKLEDCCDYNAKKDINEWNLNKLQKLGLLKGLNNKFGGKFKAGPVYSSAVANIIEQKCPDTQLNQKIREMTYVEGHVRNMVAHDIVSVTDEWIKQRSRKSAREIFSLIQYLIVKAGIPVNPKDWDSYDYMNQSIIEALEE